MLVFRSRETSSAVKSSAAKLIRARPQAPIHCGRPDIPGQQLSTSVRFIASTLDLTSTYFGTLHKKIGPPLLVLPPWTQTYLSPMTPSPLSSGGY
jgi:hypothetical protein